MNTIIEKIRAEVESKIRDTNNDTSVGAMESLTISKTLRNVLSILSDIEESEKPTIQEQPVEKEMEETCRFWLDENGKANLDRYDIRNIAFRFYTLGRQSKEQPVDLDDAINNWQGIEAFPEGCGITPLPKAMEIVDKTARHFYELGRNTK